MKHAIAALLSLGLSLVCAHPGAAAPLKVAASFSILGDMVKNVGGDRVDVVTLVGPGGDTHVYQPTPADAKSVAGAGLIFVSGLGFEGWMERLVKTSGGAGRLVTASEGVTPLTAPSGEHGARPVTDPHAWQDLQNGKRYVANIEKALALADPAGAQVYAANAAVYTRKIEAMDAWVKAEFASIPRRERKMITSHDAFGYFGHAYSVTILAPVGYSTESEASALRVGELIRQIRNENVKALFVENMSDPRLIERIGGETGVKPGGALYSDALSPPSGPAATYLDMFKNNVTLMVAAMRRKGP